MLRVDHRQCPSSCVSNQAIIRGLPVGVGVGLRRGVFVDELRAAVEKAASLPALLGYLNFSEGRPDAPFQKQLSDAMSMLHQRGLFEPWKALRDLMHAELSVLRQGQSSAFRDTEQVEGVLRLAFECVLPAYRAHHADLLFHQSDNDLYQP